MLQFLTLFGTDCFLVKTVPKIRGYEMAKEISFMYSRITTNVNLKDIVF